MVTPTPWVRPWSEQSATSWLSATSSLENVSRPRNASRNNPTNFATTLARNSSTPSRRNLHTVHCNFHQATCVRSPQTGWKEKREKNHGKRLQQGHKRASSHSITCGTRASGPSRSSDPRKPQNSKGNLNDTRPAPLVRNHYTYSVILVPLWRSPSSQTFFLFSSSRVFCIKSGTVFWLSYCRLYFNYLACARC